MSLDQNLQNYIDNGFQKVEGFCPISTLLVLDHLDKFTQKSAGAMEIGIHHGQLYLALNQLISPDKKSYAIDLFDSQELNIDHSGDGNKQRFVQNLQKYDRHNGMNTNIIEGDSTDLSIFEEVERCHYISVDGGHTPEHVINDLSIACKMVTNNGVVIVDDYLNHWWPSVTEGIFKYLSTNPTLVPFATSANKMWMCKLSYKPQYLNHVKQIPSFNRNDVKIFGHDVLNLW